jgi:hypothetical protein
MRLEITVCKEIIRMKFIYDSRFDSCTVRLNNHTLVISDELKSSWEEDSKNYNYNKNFEQWFSSIVSQKKKLKKVNINGIDKSDCEEEKDIKYSETKPVQ